MTTLNVHVPNNRASKIPEEKSDQTEISNRQTLCYGWVLPPSFYSS